MAACICVQKIYYLIVVFLCFDEYGTIEDMLYIILHFHMGFVSDMAFRVKKIEIKKEEKEEYEKNTRRVYMWLI